LKRNQFIKIISSTITLASLSGLYHFASGLGKQNQKMPILFIGHGSPMNAIENNKFSSTWQELGKSLPVPNAILCISAHWLTKGTFVTAMEHPKTIHDFYGFPKELFEVNYPAPGDPVLAQNITEAISNHLLKPDHEWGLDHWCWSVVKQLYPEAKIPVLQLSLDYNQSGAWHLDLGSQLSTLRERGVLIIGSGNMVHNLKEMSWDTPNSGFDWAEESNSIFKKLIEQEDFQALATYKSLGKAVQLAVPTPDHYFPMLYILGLKEKQETLRFFNDETQFGSISMTSFIIHQ
jgi:4,5-DOPA dioxygenase extradiol